MSSRPRSGPVEIGRCRGRPPAAAALRCHATTDGPPVEIRSPFARITRFGRDRAVDESRCQLGRLCGSRDTLPIDEVDGNVGTLTFRHQGFDKFRSLDELLSALSLPRDVLPRSLLRLSTSLPGNTAHTVHGVRYCPALLFGSQGVRHVNAYGTEQIKRQMHR